MHDRRKYLAMRCALYTILVYVTFVPFFYTKNINERVFFTTTSLLILPLCLEYYKGLATFNKVSFFARRFSLLITSFYVMICFVALTGGISIIDNDHKFAASVRFFIGPDISIWFFKVLIILIPLLTFFDWVFTLSSQELEKYKVQDKVNEMLSQKMESVPRKEAISIKAQEIMKDINLERTEE